MDDLFDGVKLDATAEELLSYLSELEQPFPHDPPLWAAELERRRVCWQKAPGPIRRRLRDLIMDGRVVVVDAPTYLLRVVR